MGVAGGCGACDAVSLGLAVAVPAPAPAGAAVGACAEVAVGGAVATGVGFSVTGTIADGMDGAGAPAVLAVEGTVEGTVAGAAGARAGAGDCARVLGARALGDAPPSEPGPREAFPGIGKPPSRHSSTAATTMPTISTTDRKRRNGGLD
ncbi:MAG: hypothetical protein H6983_21255 [Ectothiorhodospiraceae bacterium]|nr:hypothetical protein [Chromatiales bacterium]MCP5156717.1 hypothetical protein [Ectothiorhodospiraceae bacterium]